MTRQETLQDLVADRRAELGLSLRQAAEKSGGRVSHSTFGAIEHGQRTRVDDTTIEGLAEALSVPLGRVRRAAGLSERQLPPFVLPARADRLNARERRVVLAMIETLLAAREVDE